MSTEERAGGEVVGRAEREAHVEDWGWVSIRKKDMRYVVCNIVVCSMW